VKYLVILLLLSTCNNINTPYIDNITLLKVEKKLRLMVMELLVILLKKVLIKAQF
jgi:hypothetical protein